VSEQDGLDVEAPVVAARARQLGGTWPPLTTRPTDGSATPASPAVRIRLVTDLEALTAADFAPLVHEPFRIDDGDGSSFTVELIDVSETGAQGHGRIFGVEHDRMGRLEIFLVPLGPDDVGQRYEAVFA
jgi:hypothetical protein